jgi:hypothetical protein
MFLVTTRLIAISEEEKLTPRLLWDNVKHLIQLDEDGRLFSMILL